MAPDVVHRSALRISTHLFDCEYEFGLAYDLSGGEQPTSSSYTASYSNLLCNETHVEHCLESDSHYYVMTVPL